jgi:HK97 gp10 family phage protein
LADLELTKLALDLTLMANSAEGDAKEATEEHIKQVAEKMRATVPVRTGATRDSIGYEVVVRNGVVTGEAGPTTEQAIYNEYGTVNMAPQPFAGPALESEAEEYMEDVADAAVRLW